jgi:hypothetical protein
MRLRSESFQGASTSIWFIRMRPKVDDYLCGRSPCRAKRWILPGQFTVRGFQKVRDLPPAEPAAKPPAEAWAA